MKIAVISPLSGYSTQIARYAAEALADLGHQTYYLDLSTFYEPYEFVWHEYRRLEMPLAYIKSFLFKMEAAIWERLASFGPHLVLVLSPAPVPQSLVKNLRSAKIVTAYWLVDDYRQIPNWQNEILEYDFLLVNQTEPLLSELRALGIRRCAYLPLAFHPRCLQPPAIYQKNATLQCKVSFVGAPAPNRVHVFSELMEFDFGIWGKGWDSHLANLTKQVQEGSHWVSETEEMKIYTQSEIVLNLTASENPLHIGGCHLTPRIFSAAACGTFVLSDRCSLLSSHFIPEWEIASYSTVDELQEKLHYYLEHPEEREAIARRAQRRAFREHTYLRRMEQMMAILQRNHLSWWPTTAQGSSGNNLRIC